MDAPGLPLVFDKEQVPENLAIKLLEKEFKPAEFPHQKIVAKLTEISQSESACDGCSTRLEDRKPFARVATTKRITQPHRQRRYLNAAHATADPLILRSWASPESWERTTVNVSDVTKL